MWAGWLGGNGGNDPEQTLLCSLPSRIGMGGQVNFLTQG
jgi:hypothetical protein